MCNIRLRLTECLVFLERKTELLEGSEYCLNLMSCANHRHLQLERELQKMLNF